MTSHKQGRPSWVELMTTDEAGAQAFYSGLFGWTANSIPMPDGGAYHLQLLQGDNVSAIGGQRR